MSPASSRSSKSGRKTTAGRAAAPPAVRAYVIHLARAAQRRPQVEQILSACPVPIEVIDAVDGTTLSAREIHSVYPGHSLLRPHYPFTLTLGEIGCFLSHREAWRRIAEGDAAAGLVLEDDTALDGPAVARALAFALDHIEEAGIIQFQVRPLRRRARECAAKDGLRLLRPDVAELRNSATLYSRAAAAHLLEVTARFDRPVDTTLQMAWITGLWPLVVEPSGMREVSADLGGTTIQRRNRPILEKLRHEVLRPLYRFQVRQLSRNARNRS